MTATMARQKPVHTINSGLVGGIIAVKALSSVLGFSNVIGADMGGTSFDVEMIVDGNYEATPMMRIMTPKSGPAGYPLLIPAIDLHAIGAGGGSIAWIDNAGALHVGPMSSAASPGPACYGRGGKKPTVTDANLILKRLDAKYFLGGDMKVYPELSNQAVKEIADGYGMEMCEAAEGIIKIVVSNMAGAIRTMTIGRGIDPREFAMVAFGGAGPLHAALIADELDIKHIVISSMPGNFSAWGMLMTDLRRDYVQTHVETLTHLGMSVLASMFEKMENTALKTIQEEAVPIEESQLLRAVDVRYEGQGHALSIMIPNGRLTGNDKLVLEKNFDDAHLKRYLHNAPGEPKEIVALRLTAIGSMKRATLPRIKKGDNDPTNDARKGRREIYLKGTFRQCEVYDRDKLLANNTIIGPAIVEERTSTTLLLPDQLMRVDDYGNLLLSEK